MLIATLKNTKAKNVDLQEYFAKNSLQIDPLEYFDITGKNGWFLGSKAEFKLKQKIEQNGKPLKDWDVKINYGIKTGLNEAFIIDENKKNELIAKDPKSAEIIKPILRGRDIKRYGYEFANLYVINTHNGCVEETPSLHNGKQGLSSTKIPPININNYPAIKEHLDSFEPALSKRSDKGVTPYNLRNCAYLDEFEKEKVVWGQFQDGSEYSLSPKGFTLSSNEYMLCGDYNRKFFLGLLNSKIVTYYLSMVSNSLGESSNIFQKSIFETIPIPTLNTPEKQQIAGQIELLVEELLAVKNLPLTKGSNSQSLGVNNIEPQSATQTAPLKGAMDTTSLEAKIDELIFELYGLTSEEISVIKK
jgi:hypothetical protein